jgi:hypothetical protein
LPGKLGFDSQKAFSLFFHLPVGEGESQIDRSAFRDGVRVHLISPPDWAKKRLDAWSNVISGCVCDGVSGRD